MRTRWFGLLSVISMAAANAAVGCGTGDSSVKPTESASEQAGSIGLSLTAAPGIILNAVSYAITGPGGFTKTGSIDVSKSKTISTTIGGLPAGAGYSVALTATSADGATTCAGSASFSVAARATSKVVIQLQCREPAKTGSVKLDGSVNVCPLIDGIDASPSEVLVGSPIELSATAHDADQAPAALSYHWTASGGTLASSTSASPTFTCTAAGDFTISLELSDGDCTDTLATSVTCSAPTDEILTVAATLETPGISSTGDAADDPAIWVHPTTPAGSVIIGTDKQGGGLGVYGMDGAQLQFIASGKLNNVDLRDGFLLGGTPTTIVTAGNRTDNSIAIFALDPTTRQLRDVAARKITTLVTYGSCMYKSPVSGKYYYFVDAKDGNIEQWELFDNAGLVDAIKVRDLHQLASQPEACAVDDEGKYLLVGEEAKGVWKFDAEPNVTSGPGWEGMLIASTDPGGHLERDVEGVAISKTSATAGYIFVSNQGVNTYSVFTREAPHTYVKTFRVARGAACIDEVTGSDGIEVNAANLGPAFPHGAFVTQDDSNPGSTQNFKLVPLDHILGTPPLVDDSACDGGGGAGSGGSSNGGSGGAASGGAASGGSGGAAAVGYGEPFCTSYCDKCASCYAAGGFDEGDCVYQHPKTAFTIEDCKAGCAVSATPSAAAKASLPANFDTLTCSAFDASI